MNWRKLIVPSVFVLLVLGLYSFRLKIYFVFITPLVEFNPNDVPPAPDYRKLKYWAMHPDKGGETVARDGLRVFWIHPTTYRSPLHWNENLEDEDIADRFEWTRDRQASLFSSCCRIYAPHYRQATLASFWKKESGFKARALAYEDIRQAFDQFLAEGDEGQGFVIAGHSQGTEHGLRLLQERVAGNPVQRQLVAAYLVGMPIHMASLLNSMPDIPVCSQPSDFRCLVSWATFKETTNAEKFLHQAVWHNESGYHSVSGEFVCVNPVSWQLDGLMTSQDQHLGARLRKNPGMKIKARCDQGILRVDDVDSYIDISMDGNYHLDDFALFYYDIEKNVRTRWDAFHNAHKRL